MIILDECHALSKAAWQVLLKATEEPPEHVYWAFCTTEAGKVPKTIETRAISYVLKPIKRDALFDLLDHVCEQEELNEFDDKMIQAVVNRAQGSARQALVYLQQVAHCETLDELKEAIDSLDEDDDQVIELCRTLSKKGTGVEVARLLKELKEKETNPEGIRIQVANYYAAVAIGAKGDAKRIAALDVLDLFVDPLHDQGGWPKLVLNCFAAVTE
jgi:DNA polymerase III gamma/tau subunit